ncbi:GlxA family transcriptional regulator [Rhodalgimonas zhirmunskyi]|uniref:GlxA family transcriptional regulator n=1 Tax=Rhodalgimonas zhirmunskyi TaxID=2964767 RepID=A0AAJ1X6L3_9RHOB|nr:GlxA family transcriptional regulator [Rhodoalgimonas zhirmunskyi]MDQ2094824.1 GlxA family transcriptional regulator [Rhodoalgimonas zhirmunskyi]
MPNWIAAPTPPQDVAILLFPRFSNHCLANAVEPLRAANDLLLREAYRWRFVTLEGDTVTSSSGLPVVPNGRLRDHAGGDYLFVMSSYGARTCATPATARALTSAARRFKTLAGMDTGAWLMAHAGLLDGKSATIHWDELTAFSEAFPMVDTLPDRVVSDGTTLTCGGGMTAFDLVLDLIRRTHGAALGLEVSAMFLHQTVEAPPHRVFRQRVAPLVENAVALMSANLETPLAIGAIALHLRSSQKTLTRAFTKDLGAPPATVYKRLRLAAARRYAQQSGYSITEIALRCGYANAAAMTRAFTGEYGQPPSAFRRPG